METNLETKYVFCYCDKPIIVRILYQKRRKLSILRGMRKQN